MSSAGLRQGVAASLSCGRVELTNAGQYSYPNGSPDRMICVVDSVIYDEMNLLKVSGTLGSAWHLFRLISRYPTCRASRCRSTGAGCAPTI